MHGLLMSVTSAGLGYSEAMELLGHPASGAETGLLLQCKWLGQRSLSSPFTLVLPCLPSLFGSKCTGSVKSILGGAFVLWIATVKLEWLRPGLWISFYSLRLWKTRAELLKNSQPEMWIWDELSLILAVVCLRNYHNKASRSVVPQAHV